MKVKAEAKVSMRPVGGQVIPFLLIVISAVLFLVCVWLELQDKSYLLAATGSLVFFISGVTLYLLSRKDSDMRNARAFGMTMGSGENKVAITADARSLPALDYLKEILTHWSCLLERQPLPEASGVVDEHGNPIPNSEAAAADITQKANDEAAAQLEEAVLHMRAPDAACQMQSPIID
jgi:hypothetical protein